MLKRDTETLKRLDECVTNERRYLNIKIKHFIYCSLLTVLLLFCSSLT